MQAAALVVALALAVVAVVAFGQHPLPWLQFSLLQGTLAGLLASVLRHERWWWLIHFCFAPALVVTLDFQITPLWFLLAFVVLVLLYWNSVRGRVPLYLSNATTAQALLDVLPQDRGVTVIDAGCGTGGLIKRLAHSRSDCQLRGLENAPLPWLMARWQTAGLPNCAVKIADMWAESFADADVVYAFLSPVPMPRLWQKLCAEMKPGTLLVSNSFVVPGATPDAVVEVADRRATRLYCYRIPAARV